MNIGILGLGVMGRSLALNFERNGYSVAGYDLLAPVFREIVLESQRAWRDVVKTAIDLGIPNVAISASLAYFDAYRSERLPAAMTLNA